MLKFELNKFSVRINLEPKLEKLERIIFKEFKKDGIISIAIKDEKTSKELNKSYRNKNKPTDILTFVLGDGDVLGEIILCYEEVKKRAKKEKRTTLDTTTYLIIHGICHVFGYKHDTKKEADRMEIKEEKIVKLLNG